MTRCSESTTEAAKGLWCRTSTASKEPDGMVVLALKYRKIEGPTATWQHGSSAHTPSRSSHTAWMRRWENCPSSSTLLMCRAFAQSQVHSAEAPLHILAQITPIRSLRYSLNCFEDRLK